MSASEQRIESVGRDLVVDEGFAPLEQVLPAAGWAAGLFHACLARLDSDRLELHAFLAWRGQDAAELGGRADSLRQALEQACQGMAQRVTANLFVVADHVTGLREAERALHGVKQGHFLQKILVSPAAVALNAGMVSFLGRAKPRPNLDWFEQHFVSPSPHATLDVDARLQLQQRQESSVRRLLSKGETWATWGLIALNVAVFITQYFVAARLQQQLGSGHDDSQSQDLAMQVMGANQHQLVFGKGQWWRLLACMFLHAGELHILFNMVSLFSLGSLMERLCGWARFLFIYFVAGLAGSLLSALHPDSLPSVGASGAIFGLAGALLALKFRRPPDFPLPLAERIYQSLIWPVIFTFALGLGLGLYGGPVRFDNWAHFGGVFTGFAMAWLWPSLLQKPLRGSHLM